MIRQSRLTDNEGRRRLKVEGSLMKKSRAFRPLVNEQLEERRVPSGVGGLDSGVVSHFVQSGGNGGVGAAQRLTGQTDTGSNSTTQ